MSSRFRSSRPLACDVALDGGSPALNSSWLLRLGVAAVAAASVQLRLVASLGWGLSAASALAVVVVVVLSDGQVRPRRKKSWRMMFGVEPVLAVEIGVACLSY